MDLQRSKNYKGQGHERGHPFGIESKQDDGPWGGEGGSGPTAILSGKMTTTQ